MKKVIKYIFRSWEDEPKPPHPRAKFLPPFFYDLLAYAIGLSILYQIAVYLWSLI